MYSRKILARGEMDTVLISAGSWNSGIVVKKTTTAAVAVCWLMNIALAPIMQPFSYPCFMLFLFHSWASSGVGAGYGSTGWHPRRLAELAGTNMLRNVWECCWQAHCLAGRPAGESLCESRLQPIPCQWPVSSQGQLSKNIDVDTETDCSHAV